MKAYQNGLEGRNSPFYVGLGAKLPLHASFPPSGFESWAHSMTHMHKWEIHMYIHIRAEKMQYNSSAPFHSKYQQRFNSLRNGLSLLRHFPVVGLSSYQFSALCTTNTNWNELPRWQWTCIPDCRQECIVLLEIGHIFELSFHHCHSDLMAQSYSRHSSIPVFFQRML